MIAHMWTASLTALIACTLVLVLRNVPARLRFALLLLATVRFAIPTPWLTAAGAALAACLPSRAMSTQMPSIEGLLRPGAFLGTGVPATSGGFPLELSVQVLWACGGIISLAYWLRRRKPVVRVREATPEELSALERAAERLGLTTPSLKIAHAGFIPGAAGIWRAEVILPGGLANELSAEELESVCAHELAHVRRRDSLAAAISRAIAVAFWFHPLVWWMERRMRAERELACDEMVVASGPHEAYATALSKVCLAANTGYGSFAAMAGPNLTERLERIMTKKSLWTGRGFRAMPAMVALLALLIPMGAGFLRAQATNSRAGDALYDAAIACYKQKDYVQAETLFRRMLVEFPTDGRGVTGVAEVLYAQNRADEAIRLMRETAENNPSSLDYRMAVGNLHVRAENYSAALAEYASALKLASTLDQVARVYFSLGETHRRMGKLQDAITAFRREKDFSGKASLQLALLLDGTGEGDRAMDEYKALLVEDPGHAVALNNLAYKLAEQGDKLEQALVYALRAQRAVPASPDVTDTVGWIYLKKRLPNQAEVAFTNALLATERADNPLFRQHLAAALDLRSEWTPDRRELRTLLDTAKTEAQLQRLQALLRAAQ